MNVMIEVAKKGTSAGKDHMGLAAAFFICHLEKQKMTV
jgi:hypothetical protein